MRDAGDERERWGGVAEPLARSLIVGHAVWFGAAGQRTWPTDRRFTGQRLEAGVGLYDCNARYYSPLLARFISPDTLVPDPANPQALNRYAYVLNHPLKYTDPSGHTAVCTSCQRSYLRRDDADSLRSRRGDIPVQITKPSPKINVRIDGPARPLPEINTRVDGPSKPQPKINTPVWPTGTSGPYINIAFPDPFGKDKIIAAKQTDEAFGSTLKPGPFAGESIPARSPERDFTDEERAEIDRIGRETGCHTCGTKDPGTVSGHFIPDHQPPSALNVDGQPQRLYPHCLSCSLKQGGEVRVRIRNMNNAEG